MKTYGGTSFIDGDESVADTYSSSSKPSNTRFNTEQTSSRASRCYYYYRYYYYYYYYYYYSLLFVLLSIVVVYYDYFDALFSLFLFPAKPIERNRDIKPLFSSFFPSSATLTSLNISTICSNSGRVFISACHEYWMVCARTWWQLCGMVGRMPLWTTPTAAWRGVYPE